MDGPEAVGEVDVPFVFGEVGAEGAGWVAEVAGASFSDGAFEFGHVGRVFHLGGLVLGLVGVAAVG